MASGRLSKVKGKVVDIPTVPTIGTATAGAELATVAFTPSTIGGTASTYTALSNPGSVTGSGASSPVTVSGLTAGTAYTFTVRGNNATGSSEYSSASNSVTPTVATSYESIATVTLSSANSTIEFTSIPGTFKHLQIRYMSPSGSYGTLRFNNDTTASNYYNHYLYGDGSSTGSGANANNAYLPEPGGWSNPAAGITDILDYTNTSKYKTIRSLEGYESNGSGAIYFVSNLWKSTSAITSIKLIAQGANFGQYSSFALYGIKGA